MEYVENDGTESGGSKGLTSVAMMEKALASLDPHCTTVLVPEPVPNVPGAFVLRGCLQKEECEPLAEQVRQVHKEWAIANGTRNTNTNTSTNTTANPAPAPRRKSQHHLPCRVSQSSLSILSARIRPFLSTVAGPTAPSNRATLLPKGEALSSFLRCYHYRVGDTSTPHYDKSYTTHKMYEGGDSKRKRNGPLATFSAYSVLLYVNDHYKGGGTTFFQHDSTIRVTRRGLTPISEDLNKLIPHATVVPNCGDVLIFPHGNMNGCHPNPLHEGSTVLSGEKCLIRTDLIYNAPPSKKGGGSKRKKQKRE
jgi:hypothetical protein